MEKEAEKEAELDGSDYAREHVTMVDISKYFLDYHKKKREKEEEEETDPEKMMEEEDSNNMDTTETGTCTCTYIYIYMHISFNVIQILSLSPSSPFLSLPRSSSLSSPIITPCSFSLESQSPLPPAVQSCIDVLQSSVHYLSTPNPPLQLCLLECVSLCLLSLKERESESHHSTVRNVT